MTEPSRVEDIETTVGLARAHVYAVPWGVPRATLILGHGAGGGVSAWDLQLLAGELPALGVDTILIEQPWRVAGKRVAEAKPRLDAAFRESVTSLRRSGVGLRRLLVGGRSTGARVACRTAADVGAAGVLCLAFPLHRPGHSADPRRVAELAVAGQVAPVTVIQGERDSFGRPAAVADAAADAGLRSVVVAVPWADHSFKLPKRATITREEAALVIVEAVRRAVLHRSGNGGPLLAR